VHRLAEWVDRLQQRHAVLGFPYAVVRKYGDDGGGREAALITYYGFLSIFPVLLLGVTIVSEVLTRNPDLRHEIVLAIVPPSLQSTVESGVAALPTSRVALAAGAIGLLLAGTGVVFSAYQTLNHVAAVPFRQRPGFVSRYVRAVGALILILLGVLAVGGLTVIAAGVPQLPRAAPAAAMLGSCLTVYILLLFVARILLVRPAPMRVLWPAAAPGAVVVTLVLNVGTTVLPSLVRRAGPVYGGFATVAGMFSLLYFVSLALVYAAEVAAVRYARLWPRAMDRTRPTAADARALALLAREQERIPGARIESRLVSPPG
jgi:membrane protein